MLADASSSEPMTSLTLKHILRKLPVGVLKHRDLDGHSKM